jgi:hypothetical protein
VDKILLLPAEDRRGELHQVANLGDDLVFFVPAQASDKALVIGSDVAIDVRLSGKQRRNRHDQAHGLDIAEPFQVSNGFGIT